MSTEENTVNTDVQSTDIVADTSPLDLTSEVSTHFLSALINNDYSGLNDMETVFYTGANNCMGHTIQNHWREKVTVTLEYKRNKLTLIDLSL